MIEILRHPDDNGTIQVNTPKVCRLEIARLFSQDYSISYRVM